MTRKTLVVAVIISVSVIALAAIGIYFVTSNSDIDNLDINDPTTWYEPTRYGGIDEDLAERISVGMTFYEIADILGKPQRDVGSGVVIMEWEMRSGKVLNVAFRFVSSGTNTEAADDLVSYCIEIKDPE
jgi:hypothetical protein